MSQLILGATGALLAVAGIFFWRFWRQTRDRFFLLFSLAMWAFALNRVTLGWTDPANESRYLLYVVRLLATLLIIAAVVDKNLQRAPDDEQR